MRKLFAFILVVGTLGAYADRALGHNPDVTCTTASNDFSIPATVHYVNGAGVVLAQAVVPAAPSSTSPVTIQVSPPSQATGYYVTWGDGFRVPAGTGSVSLRCGTTPSTQPTTTTVVEATTTTSSPSTSVAPTSTAPSTSSTSVATSTTVPFDCETLRPDSPPHPECENPIDEGTTTTRATIPGYRERPTDPPATLPSTGASTTLTFGLTGGVLLGLGFALCLLGVFWPRAKAK